MGRRASGKKTFARRLAQSLLCVTPKSTLLGYCGICSGCTQRDRTGCIPISIVSEGQVKIGDRDASGFHGAEDADRARSRAPALDAFVCRRPARVRSGATSTSRAKRPTRCLKFFEEPPPGVLLLLTTTAVARLLPTVRSRLLEVTFPLLTTIVR